MTEAGKIVLRKPGAKPAVKKTDDPTIMTYRALMPLKVATRSGEVEERMYGDYVPEVLTWPKPGIWLQTARIEVAYINQSEYDRWRAAYEIRLEQEREFQREADENAAEIARVEAQLRELQVKAKKVESAKLYGNPDGNSQQVMGFTPDPTVEQKIDFGGVKMANGGVPRPVELPAVTRAPILPQNAGDNRTRQATVRRSATRKKV
jgi:hypothetical protein